MELIGRQLLASWLCLPHQLVSRFLVFWLYILLNTCPYSPSTISITTFKILFYCHYLALFPHSKKSSYPNPPTKRRKAFNTWLLQEHDYKSHHHHLQSYFHLFMWCTPVGCWQYTWLQCGRFQVQNEPCHLCSLKRICHAIPKPVWILLPLTISSCL